MSKLKSPNRIRDLEERPKKIKEIICFGGGNVIPKVVLEPLKKYQVKIISVTSMTESGGSTGQLGKDFNVLPAGDISRHLVGLSDAPEWKKKLFYLRFGREKFPGGHIGHRFGTVFISLTEYVLGDFKKALKSAHDFMEVRKHKVLPATLNKTQLMAELEDEKIIEGEDEIDVPKKHDSRLKIKRVFLKPKAKAYKPVLEAIKNGDLIVFGPGDLYSSIIPCFLPKGIKKALQRSKAKKVFICSLMTKRGETNKFSVLDFTDEIEKYIGCVLDFVIFNNFFPNKKIKEKYKKENPTLLNFVNFDKSLADNKKFIGANLLPPSRLITHHPNKLAKIILSI